MDDIRAECRRCKGRGTILCKRCQGTGWVQSHGIPILNIGTNRPVSADPDCRICKGIGELQCPACGGKAAFTAAALEEVDGQVPQGAKPLHTPDRHAEREATTARLVLAIHYLLDAAKSNLDNKAPEIRLIEFLTGRNKDDIAEKLTEIRERGNPADKRNKKVKPRSRKARKEDLELVKPLFKDLKLTTIVDSIDGEIKSINEDAA